jgi:hypothetical protein
MKTIRVIMSEFELSQTQRSLEYMPERRDGDEPAKASGDT